MKKKLLIFTLILFCAVSQAFAQRRLSDWVMEIGGETSTSTTTPDPDPAPDPDLTPQTNHKRVAFIFSQTHIYDFDANEFVQDKNCIYRVGNFIQVKSALEKFGNFDSIGYLVGPQMNRDNVKKVFQSLAEVTNSGDEIFIYWESHGGTDSDGVLAEHSSEEEDAHNEYLILGKNSREEVLTDDEFADLLFLLKGRRVMLLMEACHSGGLLHHDAQSRSFNRNSGLSNMDDPDSFAEELEDLCGNIDYSSLVPMLDSIITSAPASMNHMSLANFSSQSKSTKKQNFFKNVFKRFKTKDIRSDHPDLSVIFSAGETEASYCALLNADKEIVSYDRENNRWHAGSLDNGDLYPIGAPVFALIVALSDKSGKYSQGNHTDFRDVWNIVKDLVPANCGRINSGHSSSESQTTQTPQYMNNTGPIDVRPER